MRKNIQALQDIVSRKGSSKVLTFSIPHVLKSLQLLTEEKFVSRATFGKEIHLGEGAVKTLILHLKEAGMIDTTKSGTFLTEKGHKLINQIQSVISKECKIKKCSILQGKYNHAVLLKNYSNIVKTGLEQRDYAILYGSSGCTTMICKNKKIVFPGDEKECFIKDIKTGTYILENLSPNEGDVIIISSSNDPFVAEISAKNSALWTLASV
ncbi:MAG: DUF4443 domain-containing protein [Nitrosopumilus sp.]|nr:DUF4443 domain-containing protein [Nitrosopumilus sp.]